jgi:ATP-dependent Lon protease
MAIKKIPYSELKWQPSKGMKELFKHPEKIKPTGAIIGQKRAVEALDLGLKLYKPGYNIYVAGMAGTGRITTIKRALELVCAECDKKPVAPDRCYVHNFVDQSQPVLLTFESGQGRLFKEDMVEFIRVLKIEIPKTLESSHIQREREMLIDRYQRKEKKFFEDFAEMLKKEGFALIQIQEGGYVAPTVFPIIGKEAVSIDYLENLVKEGKLTEDEKNKKVRRHKELSAQLKEVLSKARTLGKEMHQAIDRLVQRSASLVLDDLMDELQLRYKDENVRKYLLRVKAHILQNIDGFSGKKEQGGGGAQDGGIIVIGGGSKQPEDPFWYYEVNLLYDTSTGVQGGKYVPIIEEDNPSYTNIFGAVEYNISPGGFWNTDFRHIKAGSLLKADGGYIIINAMDILRRPYVWDQLKRVLKAEKLTIQQPETHFQIAPLTLKPEPIDLKVKVIMVGPSWIYHVLYNYEEDFSKTFKVLSDFDTTMPLNEDSAKEYASVLKAVCERGDIKSFDTEGMLAMVEHGIEESRQRDRISTKFSYITDVLREADYWAGHDKKNLIGRKHVEKALDAKRERHRLTEEHVQRMIDEGIILIDTDTKRVGQINGLSVYQMGHVSFGKPSRVTATTSIGNSGIVNVEREAKLSGPIHDKGVLILNGFLKQKYAQHEPLNLSASICFEQSYGGIDGDSASSTEIYAILSSLSNVPIRQDLAVTGSVNQLGDIQPIGGVNEKIEGFFDVCKARGLNGKQGVVVPVQNERHLMLHREVVEAVKTGKFHIYSVSNIDDGIEILMGKPAGKMKKDGTYPANTVHGLAQKRLREMNEVLAKMGVGRAPKSKKGAIKKKVKAVKKRARKK